MAKKSTNQDGNPWHDEETGEFTSADGGGAKKQAAKKTGKKKAPFQKKPTLQLKEGFSLADMMAKLQDINSGISVGPLNTAEEVEQNIEKFFSKQVISHIDRLFGKSEGCDKWQFHPPGNKYMNLALFTCLLGKYRYPDNHAHILKPADFDKLALDTQNYTKVYRGFTSTGERRKEIIKSYITADINNLSIYGANTCYGTNVYTSTSYEYSLHNYANSDPARVLHCLVDRNSRKIKDRDLCQEWAKVRGGYDYGQGKYVDAPLLISMKQKLEAHLAKNGINPERAHEMAEGFGENLRDDRSLMAVLLGYDYQISSGDQQRNILNLNKWYIRG